MKNGLIEDELGSQRYYNSKNQLHRNNDLPAIIWADGSKEWYKNGQRHREDGPAVEFIDGRKWWYKNGIMVTNNLPKWSKERKTQNTEKIQKDIDKIKNILIEIPIS